MHEFAVTKSVIHSVIEEASKYEAKKISKVTLVIGDLSSIIDESVQMYYNLLTDGTIMEGSVLEFKRVRAELFCNNCAQNYPKPKTGLECPTCGETGKLTDKGKEFYIESFEMDEE